MNKHKKTLYKNAVNFKAVVVGVSAGGMNALKKLLPLLTKDVVSPVIIVQHVHPDSDSFLVKTLDEMCVLNIKEAEDKEYIQNGTIYLAPPAYHLLIENDKSFSLSGEERVNYSRPSIDVLFESASDVYHSKLIGIILTGANDDGSQGLKLIKERGGLAIVQTPETAELACMPKAAIAATKVDYILPLEQIAKLLVKLSCNGGNSNNG